MKHVLFALLLLTAVPAFAAKEERPMSPVPEQATAGYMTFPLQTGEKKTNTGCLWRLPVIDKDGLQVFAAVSTVRTPMEIESALQVAGSFEKDGQPQAASFSDARLTADTFDTEKIATKRESGPTARVVFNGAQTMALVTAVTDHGGKLFYTHEGKKHEIVLPKPTGNDTAQIWFCLTQLQSSPPAAAVMP